MSLTLQQNIHFGLGFSSLPDAFQSGREAAQMAKSQLPDGPADLVIVIGPDSIHFQDFVEGVRLITGEDQLIGLPAKRITSTETTAADVTYVIVLRSQTTHLSLTFTEMPQGQSLLSLTALFHQLRQIRGNASYEEPYGGLLVVNRMEAEAQESFVERLSLEAGFKSDLICLTPLISPQTPFVVRSRQINQGLVALEYLSGIRWAMGSVDVESFDKKPGLVGEAVKSAVRDSLAQLKGRPPAVGFLFYDSRMETENPHDILNGAAGLLPHVPLLAVPTAQQFVRSAGRSAVAQRESIVSLLVPR